MIMLMIIITMINYDKDICGLYVNYTLTNDGDSGNDDDVGERRLRKIIRD